MKIIYTWIEYTSNQTFVHSKLIFWWNEFRCRSISLPLSFSLSPIEHCDEQCNLLICNLIDFVVKGVHQSTHVLTRAKSETYTRHFWHLFGSSSCWTEDFFCFFVFEKVEKFLQFSRAFKSFELFLFFTFEIKTTKIWFLDFQKWIRLQIFWKLSHSASHGIFSQSEQKKSQFCENVYKLFLAYLTLR